MYVSRLRSNLQLRRHQEKVGVTDPRGTLVGGQKVGQAVAQQTPPQQIFNSNETFYSWGNAAGWFVSVRVTLSPKSRAYADGRADEVYVKLNEAMGENQ